MKKVVLIILLCVSVGLNIYFIGSNYIKSTYTPSDEDLDILGEMTKKVIDTEQYKEIAEKEEVISIKPSVNRFNVAKPKDFIHYEVFVKTDEQTYIFYCSDHRCSTVSNEGWMYSEYKDEKPLLPTDKK